MSPIPSLLLFSVLFAVNAAAALTECPDGVQSVEILLLNQAMTQLQQQAEQLQSLRKKVVSLETQLALNTASFKGKGGEAGEKQVAFSARYAGQTAGFNVGTGGTLKYDKVLINAGNGYAPHTGVFTAPYAGAYAFFTSLRSDNQHGWILLGIFKGDIELVQVTGEGKADTWDRGSGFVITHLNEGEAVFVRQMGGSTYLERGPFTTFSGMLVAAD